MEKRTEIITLRTTTSIKKTLEHIASEKKWSISQLCEEILQEYIKKNQ